MDINQLFASPWMDFTLVLIVGLVFAYVLKYVLNTLAKRYVGKTQTAVDDILLEKLHSPVVMLVMLAVIAYAFTLVSLPKEVRLWLDYVFYVMGVLLIGLVISRLIISLMQIHTRSVRHDSFPRVFGALTNIVVFSVALVIILDYFDVQIAPLVATLGLGGLAIGLALKDTLSNLFSGLHLLATKSFRVGDYIKVEGQDVGGYVEDIGWRETLIRTFQNQLIVFPNSKLSESIIINTQLPNAESSVVLACGVAYDSDLDKVEKIVHDEAKNAQMTEEGAVHDFDPLVRFHTFGDSNIEFNIILRSSSWVDQYKLKHEFVKRLKKRFDKEKIEISFPARKIYQSK